ncbi:MAG: hypothetical protein AMXMBFR82_03770 [Candidatus Hydrogenedentota bacterium]
MGTLWRETWDVPGMFVRLGGQAMPATGARLHCVAVADNDIGQPTYYNIPNGMTTNYTYDTRNRLTAIEHKDGTTVLDGFTYALDDAGNIATTTHEDGSFWEYLYDGRYRLTSAVRSNANETIEANYAYTYDAGDNLLTKVEPFEDDFNDGNYTGWSAWSGTWSAASMVGVFRYHAQPRDSWRRGRFRSAATAGMTPGSAGTIAKANTDNDLELRFSYVCNDTSNAGYALTVSPRYASSGDRIYVEIKPGSINLSQRVSGVWSSLDTSATSSTQGVEYTIRVVCDGQDVTVYRTAPGALEEEILSTSSCTVASTNNLSFTPSLNADFSIDNIRILSDDLSNATTFAVNNANELTSMTDYNGSTTFGFDAWGEMTGKSRGSYTASYAWRYGGMLRSVTSNFPGEGGATFEYGGDGNRRSRVAGASETWYNWGAGLLNEETGDDGLGSLSRLYLAGGLGDQVGGTTRYSTYDIVSAMRGTYAQDKSAVANIEYTPYGSSLYESGSASPIGHSAHIPDVDTGLTLTPARPYSPEVCRWLSPEPFGIDGPNLYHYALGNPVRFFDSTGLAARGSGMFDILDPDARIPTNGMEFYIPIFTDSPVGENMAQGFGGGYNGFTNGFNDGAGTNIPIPFGPDYMCPNDPDAQAGEWWGYWPGLALGIALTGARKPRSMAARGNFLRSLADDHRIPSWMIPWLKRGKVPPGYNVDHIKPLSVGGADLPSNMRLIAQDLHVLWHKRFNPWTKVRK